MCLLDVFWKFEILEKWTMSVVRALKATSGPGWLLGILWLFIICRTCFYLFFFAKDQTFHAAGVCMFPIFLVILNRTYKCCILWLILFYIPSAAYSGSFVINAHFSLRPRVSHPMSRATSKLLNCRNSKYEICPSHHNSCRYEKVCLFIALRLSPFRSKPPCCVELHNLVW